MARPKKRKKALRRRKERVCRRGNISLKSVLRVASQWPVHEVLISKEWKKPHELAQILVGRGRQTLLRCRAV